MWACAQIPTFAAQAAELCAVLVLLGTAQAVHLAGKLQGAMDAYTQVSVCASVCDSDSVYKSCHGYGYISEKLMSRHL